MWWVEPVVISAAVGLTAMLVSLLPSQQEIEELEESNMSKASDANAARKLANQKKNNSLQRSEERTEGRDNQRTRDGGTTRRTWLPKRGGR